VWPYLVLNDDILRRVGLQDAARRDEIDVYDESARVKMWVACDVGLVIEVQEGQQLYVKDRNVEEPINFHSHYLSRSLNLPPHLRNNLAGERRAVRDAYKKAEASSGPMISEGATGKQRSLSSSSVISLSDSDSDSGSSELPPPTFASVALCTSTAALMAPSNNPSTPHTPTQPSPSPPPLSDTHHKRRWPADYYVCDVRDCFFDSTTFVTFGGRRRTNVDRLAAHFPRVVYKSSTWNEHKTLWLQAPERLKQKFLDAGRTEDGLWRAFAEKARRYNKSRS